MSIGVCILTLNGAKHLQNCLPPLLDSPLNPRVLVVDSTSNDNSVEIAQSLGAETVIIPRKDFNHGLTREMARQHLGTDIVVMVTQDAYAKDNTVIGTLVEPILQKKASAAYARQLPHKGAGYFESFHRTYNYPAKSELRQMSDLNKLGRQLYFCSNSFAAYSNAALTSVGGFQKVLLGEDTLAVAKLLKQGYKVAYVAEAEVYHSHDYSLLQEFKRHYDTGYARKEFAHEFEGEEGDSPRGKAYAKELLRQLSQKAPQLLPYGCMVILSKWLGYHMGRWGHGMPLGWNRLFSAHKSYFQQ